MQSCLLSLHLWSQCSVTARGRVGWRRSEVESSHELAKLIQMMDSESSRSPEVVRRRTTKWLLFGGALIVVGCVVAVGIYAVMWYYPRTVVLEADVIGVLTEE